MIPRASLICCLILTPALLLPACTTPAPIGDMPDWLSPEDAPAARRIHQVEQALQRNISIALTDATLLELTQAVSLAADIPILFDTPGLRAAGFDLDRRASLNLYHVTARHALDESLHLFRDPAGLYEADYRITPSGLTVGTVYSDALVPFDRHSPYSAWNLLRQTRLLAASQIGPAGVEPKPFAAMRTLVQSSRGPYILNQLALDASATWAGRLYALVGLTEVDPAAFDRARPLFESVEEPVAVQIGITMQIIPVRDAVMLIPDRFPASGSISR